MNEFEALRMINDTAALQSLLYDLDMMPEQLERWTRNWYLMLAYAHAYQAGRDSVPLKDVAF